MLLSNRVENISLSIAQYQDQIEELQGKIAALQRHQQKVESASAACENAIEQLKIAYNLLLAVAPEEIETLRNAVGSVFSPPLLEASNVDIEDIEDVEAVNVDVEDEADNVEVEAGTKFEDVEVEVVNVEDDNVDVEDDNVDVEDVEDVEDIASRLQSLTKAKLLEIAKRKGLKISSSLKKEEIVNLLLPKIEVSDI